MTFRLEDIHVVYPTDEPVSSNELDELESQFGAPLPFGYRDYLTRLGHGWLNDDVQLYCPDAKLREKQRELLAQEFADSRFSFDGPELTQSDINDAIQIGICLRNTIFIACPRYPGRLFDLYWGGEIKCLESGVEVLDPLSGMLACGFAFFEPVSPAAISLNFASASKRIEVYNVTQSIRSLCSDGAVHVFDILGDSGRTPYECIFLEAIGARVQIFRAGSEKSPKIHLQAHLPKSRCKDFEAVLEAVAQQLRVTFKPA
ncbi:MAG TPA: hypothetical protein PLY87_29330 [Planctomycetaceae bacterium]|nr:hypothetical protein [Planctomycetaceae bacterium]HQZ69239.1 hypothetical protein [Planctomycetaceae bacterium]